LKCPADHQAFWFRKTSGYCHSLLPSSEGWRTPQGGKVVKFPSASSVKPAGTGWSVASQPSRVVIHDLAPVRPTTISGLPIRRP
jgi:hypothetical protein